VWSLSELTDGNELIVFIDSLERAEGSEVTVLWTNSNALTHLASLFFDRIWIEATPVLHSERAEALKS